MVSTKMRLVLLLLLLTAACGNAMNDLYPSAKNKYVPLLQKAPDFTLSDSLGNNVTLSSVVATPGVRGTVLYFTMWCPICVGDMNDINTVFLPQYPNVRFFAVDYVSGSVTDARAAEVSNGFAGSGFTVLADTHQYVLALYQATMGTTVVIDKNGYIRMNEGYKFSRLQTVLAGLP